MRGFFLCFSIIILLLPKFLYSSIENAQEHTAQNEWISTWLPKREKIFPSLIADPWETQQFIYWMNNYKLIGKIGSQVSFYHSIKKDFSKKLQLYADLLTFNSMRYRIEDGGGFDLDTSDTKFGLQLEYKHKKFMGRLGFEHISAHLADGLLWPKVKKTKQHYSREFIQLNISYEFLYFIPYAGIHFVASQRHPKEYEGKSFFIFQWGGEAFYPLFKKTYFLKSIDLFLAADWQSKQEYGFFTNQSYIAGLRFQGNNEEPFRIGLHLYTGYDPRGEFYNSKTTYWGFGFQQAL